MDTEMLTIEGGELYRSTSSLNSASPLSCLPFIRSGQNHLARHSEREKKTRQTEKEVGRQHQGMDRPGLRQVPECRGEQGNNNNDNR